MGRARRHLRAARFVRLARTLWNLLRARFGLAGYVGLMAVLAIMLAALAWALLAPANRSLASIELIAFAAMVQFTPHLLLAAKWGADANLWLGLSRAATSDQYRG